MLAIGVGDLGLVGSGGLPMSEEKGSAGSSSPKLCARCGSRMPPQKRGRPRRWCSRQCRQSAYEERHGLESWKDKQPRVSDMSDLVEASQSRGSERESRRRRASSASISPRPPTTPSRKMRRRSTSTTPTTPASSPRRRNGTASCGYGTRTAAHQIVRPRGRPSRRAVRPRRRRCR